MSAAPAPRWLWSFADLALLLLGFFVALHMADGQGAAAVRATFAGRPMGPGPVDLAADAAFEPGEALLRPAAAARLHALGRGLAGRHADVRVESRGGARGGARFDGWELAAARTAAVARALAAGGLAPARIRIALPADPAGATGGQALRILPG